MISVKFPASVLNKLKIEVPKAWLQMQNEDFYLPNTLSEQESIYFESLFAEAFGEFFKENTIFQESVIAGSCPGCGPHNFSQAKSGKYV